MKGWFAWRNASAQRHRRSKRQAWRSARRLVAFPTETVYGLGADATNDRAVARIFEAKGRPRFNPLIVHLSSLAEAARHCLFNADAERLARAFWPGGLTLVLPRRQDTPLSLLVSAGLDTVALRVLTTRWRRRSSRLPDAPSPHLPPIRQAR